MRKIIFLLASFAIVLCMLQGCQKKPLGVIHRSSYTDNNFYDERTQPYLKYDSIVFTDGSAAVWKTAHAPQNIEIIVKDSKCRKTAIISCGSEVSPIFQLPRYDAEDRLSELLVFAHEVYTQSPFSASWYDAETDKFDLAAIRNCMEHWTIDNLPEDAEPVLYRFSYNDDGYLTCVSSSDGEKIEAPAGHYLTAELVYEPEFWISDFSGSSHELYITQTPLHKSAEEYVTAKYIGLTKMYEIAYQSEERKQIKVYGANSEYEYTCLETIDVVSGPDGNVYTHEYDFKSERIKEYFKDYRKVRMEKYSEVTASPEVYRYEYPEEDIVMMYAEKWDTNLCRTVKQAPQKLKVWDDLYEDHRLYDTDYAESVYNSHV